MYFIIGFLSVIGEKKSILWKLFIVLIIAVITEFIQSYIDMRRSDPIDMYFDYLGLAIGMITVLLYRYVKKT